MYIQTQAKFASRGAAWVGVAVMLVLTIAVVPCRASSGSEMLDPGAPWPLFELSPLEAPEDARSAVAIAVGDVNRDGLDDAIVTWDPTGTVWYQGLAGEARLFASPQQLDGPWTPRTVASTVQLGVPGSERFDVVGSEIRLRVDPARASDVSDGVFELVDPVIESVVLRTGDDALTDVLVLLEGDPVPWLLRTAPRATFTVNASDDTNDGGCDAAPGDCTLREAINAANLSAGADLIEFDLPTSEPIVVTSQLPNLLEAVTIQGTEVSGVLRPIDGSGCTGGGSGLIVLGDGCTLHRLFIESFPMTSSDEQGHGVVVRADDTVLRSVHVFANGASGLAIETGSGTIVGEPGSYSSFAGYSNGNHGILVTGEDTSTTTIRNTDCSNNVGDGIRVADGASNTQIPGLVNGPVELGGNGGSGLGVHNTGGVILRNCRIGIDGLGVPAGNDTHGVELVGAEFVTIGGPVEGDGNIIVHNALDGVAVLFDAQRTEIVGNWIGVLDDGSAAGNGRNGVGLAITSGVTVGPGNVIGSNAESGVLVSALIADSHDITIDGNEIGVASEPKRALRGNGEWGVEVAGADRVWIGGGLGGNTIADNGAGGVRIAGGTTSQVGVFGNQIGTDGGNFGPGVLVDNAVSVTVGGSSGSSNTISGNATDGVAVTGTAAQVTVRHNSILDNAGLGIDLADDGPTAPDSGDVDDGPNGLQNPPALVWAEMCGGVIYIGGWLESEPGGAYSVDIYQSTSCDPSGWGEGELWKHTTQIDPLGVGRDAFTVSYPIVMAGSWVSATATTADGASSEFSNSVMLATSRRGDADGDCDLDAADLAEIIHVCDDPGYDPGGTPDADGSGTTDPADLPILNFKVFV